MVFRSKKNLNLFLSKFYFEYSGGCFLQDSVLSVENLVPDKYFDAFTSPKINDRYEEKTCGEGPQLQAMFDDDKHLRSIVESIKVSKF